MDELRKKFLAYSEKINHVALLLTFMKWTLLGSLVGVTVGALSYLFLESLQFATDKRNAYPWLLYFLPLGGALISFLYIKYGKTSSQGNNLILEQIHKGDKDIPLRMAPLVFIGTIATHLFGGSAGREGTAVQMGGSIAEYIGKVLRLDKIDKRLLLMCGISSGFGAVFGTPLAGTIFGLEVISIGYLHYEALVPCFIASMVGNFTATALGAHHSHYSMTGIPEMSPIVLLKIVIISMLFGIVSLIFSEFIHISKVAYSRFIKNGMIKAVVGGLIIILLTYIIGSRDYLGLGVPLISSSFDGDVSKAAFLWKIIFTSVTLGAGFQGGEVTPFFFVGATFGNALGGAFNLSPSFLAGLGLISVFCGATNTPLTSFILGLELFGGNAVVYLFMASLISYLFSGHHGIYTSQKIYRTKSRILQVPQDATIATMRRLRRK